LFRQGLTLKISPFLIKYTAEIKLSTFSFGQKSTQQYRASIGTREAGGTFEMFQLTIVSASKNVAFCPDNQLRPLTL